VRAACATVFQGCASRRLQRLQTVGGIMPSEWSNFLSQHWIAGGVATSIVWFAAGMYCLSKNKTGEALFWRSVAVFIVLVLIFWTIHEKRWWGLLFSVGLLFAEVYSLWRSSARQGH
jgi:hypothetical protein